MSDRPIVAFRVDASLRMGTGHTVRCLTLAEELRRRGATCHFIQRLLPGHMVEAIRSRGFEVHTLPEPIADQAGLPDGDYRAWAGVEEVEDAAGSVAVLRTIGADQLVIDHYGFGAEWHSAVRAVVSRVVVIDDLANRPLDCDVLIDQNYFEDPEARYDGLVPKHCQRLCGPQFALLAPEYARAREFVGPRQGPVARVLVFYGGSDPTDQTGFALRTLSESQFSHLAVDVVVGRNYEFRASLEALARERGRTVILDPMPSLLPSMIRADLALGAGGATTWERCCVGLPAIITPIAENQVAAVEALARAGACVALPLVARKDSEVESVGNSDLARALSASLSIEGQLDELSHEGWRIAEGRGTATVTEVLMPSDHGSLVLRRATVVEVGLYWRWANDPAVRAAAFSPEPISWSAHTDWFRRRLESPHSVLWVICTEQGVPLGQLRVDVDNGQGVIDYSIDRAFRGRGLGTELLSRAVVAWRALRPDVPLRAEVRSGNAASTAALRASGLFAETQSGSPAESGGGVFTMRPYGS